MNGNTRISFIDRVLKMQSESGPGTSPPSSSFSASSSAGTGGGVVLEISGQSNTGKTMAALTLAVNWVLSNYTYYHAALLARDVPPSGSGEAVIFDFECGLIPARAAQIVRERVKEHLHVRHFTVIEGDNQHTPITIEAEINGMALWVTRRIHVVRPKTFGSALAGLVRK